MSRCFAGYREGRPKFGEGDVDASEDNRAGGVSIGASLIRIEGSPARPLGTNEVRGPLKQGVALPEENATSTGGDDRISGG